MGERTPSLLDLYLRRIGFNIQPLIIRTCKGIALLMPSASITLLFLLLPVLLFLLPAGASVPAPAGASVPAPAGASVPAPAGASVPAPAGASVPAPAGASVPAPAGASVPAPAGASVPAPATGFAPSRVSVFAARRRIFVEYPGCSEHCMLQSRPDEFLWQDPARNLFSAKPYQSLHALRWVLRPTFYNMSRWWCVCSLVAPCATVASFAGAGCFPDVGPDPVGSQPPGVRLFFWCLS